MAPGEREAQARSLRLFPALVGRNEDLREMLKKVSAPIKGTQYFLPLGGQEAASA